MNQATINSIAISLMEETDVTYTDEKAGKILEKELTNVCNSLGKVATITEGKANVDFLLSIVGSYVISKKTNTLPEDSLPPSVLFTENLFEQLRNIEESKEVIDGTTEPSEDIEGEVS